jgi:hypothetical protein
MNPLLLSAIIFALILGGILFGALLRGRLPEHHLSDSSRDVVRLGAGLVATMAALVIGLLISSAKSSFDLHSNQIKQITADIISLDYVLEQYGSDANAIRNQMRAAIAPFADGIWRDRIAGVSAQYEADAGAEKIYLAVQSLAPQTALQKSLQGRAVQNMDDLMQTRLLLLTETDTAIPLPFLCILTFWLIIIFASYSLYASFNATVMAALSLFALSAACAIFLILQLNEPFSGMLMISSDPLRSALAPLSP